MYLPFSTIAWHETNTTSSGHFNTIRVEFTPTWTPYSGSGTDYSTRDIAIYGLQIWGGYPQGRRTVHSYDQNGKMSLFGDLYTHSNIQCLGTIYDASWDGDVIPANKIATLNQDTTGNAGSVTNGVYLTGTQTISGNKNFTATANQFNGHLYYNAYDSAGNHYPHFRDGSANGGTTVNWRQYYGSSNYKTHTWASDGSGNMVFTFQGQIKAVGELEATSLDINGNGAVSYTHLTLPTSDLV